MRDVNVIARDAAGPLSEVLKSINHFEAVQAWKMIG